MSNSTVRILPERNNAQTQPVTTILRNIIREYPAGGGILRELCQNADDAGATEIKFVLDTRQHATENLLHDSLGEFQGVSLLAFNNGIFSEEDFKSLSTIGDSAKARNISSTGKFGRGFNSVTSYPSPRLRPQFLHLSKRLTHRSLYNRSTIGLMPLSYLPAHLFLSLIHI